MSARIESYLYSSGADNVVEATAGFTITEPGPVVFRVTLPAPGLFSDYVILIIVIYIRIRIQTC